MPRILTLWLPRFPVQRRLLAEPSLRSVPVFVCQRQPRGVMTVACWAWAEPPARDGETDARDPGGAAIRAGMPLAEAMAVLAMLHGSRACHRAWIDHDDPAADEAALLELARWCRRFTPAVSPEKCLEGQRPECLCLDVTATSAFFGGEERLARTAVWMLAARGIHARGAIADTVGAAWAAAHHVELAAGGDTEGIGEDRSRPASADEAEGVRRGTRHRRRRHVIVPPGGHRFGGAAGKGAEFGATAGIAALPTTALRLDGETLSRLREVGVDTIGKVARLPRRSLASRFGPLLVRRFCELTGERAEPLEVPRDGQLPHAARSFDFPLSLRGAAEETLVRCVTTLLEECVRPLVASGHGVTAFQVRLERAGAVARREGAVAATAASGADAGRRTAVTATPPLVVDVGLFRPSAAVSHLAELVRLRLVRMRLPDEIEGIAVEVVAAGAVASRQRSLFGDEESSADSQTERLLDRLSGRLGRAAVFEPRPVADDQPEHAWIAVPPCVQGGRPQVGSSEEAWHRPVRAPGDPSGARSARRGREAWRGGLAPADRRPVSLLPRPVRLETARRPAGRGHAAESPVPAWFRWSAEPGGHAVSRRGERGEAGMRRVVCAQGPERIETAWWRGPCVRRDYFVVECVGDRGDDIVERFWIFRRLRDGAWFLHGIFA